MTSHLLIRYIICKWIVKKFFSNFIKPNMFAKCMTGSHFLQLDLNEGNLPPPKKLIFAASKDQSELTILMFKTLAGKVKKAYMATLDFILKKLLLENQSMKSCKTINTLLV